MIEHAPTPPEHDPERDEAPQAVTAKAPDRASDHGSTPDHLPEAPESEEQRAERYHAEAARCFVRGIKRPTGTEPVTPQTSVEFRAEFEASYLGSFTDSDAFVDHMLGKLGWHQLLAAATRHGGIPRGALVWDYDELYGYLSRYHRIYINGEGVLHIFSIPDIRPPAADPISKGEES